ncbi:MAG: type III pantothenate kinase [Bacteroidales bacterium]|nr:type III pantothenate kinase [Bacteroidales bacterium]
MNLVFDIGNTRTKVALFAQGEMVDLWNRANADYAQAELEAYVATLCRHYEVEGAIASVVGAMPEWKALLPESLLGRLHILGKATTLPFKVDYETPDTLGADRLALVAGALNHQPQGNVLVVDAGTCITFDFIDSRNTYLGGAIMAGLRLQLGAMHNHTAKLPMLESAMAESLPLLGRSTRGCMYSGSIRTTAFAIEGYYTSLAKDQAQAPVLILTGGDAETLSQYITIPHQTHKYLLLEGLANIEQNLNR